MTASATMLNAAIIQSTKVKAGLVSASLLAGDPFLVLLSMKITLSLYLK